MPDDELSPALCSPKKVLMTADTVGGVWTYCPGVGRALGEHDVEVVLATMGAPLTRAQRKERPRVPNVRLFESTLQARMDGKALV